MANIHTQQYHIVELEHNCSPMLLAAELTTGPFCQHYLLYEHNDEWAIGINKLANLSVNSQGELTDFYGHTHRVEPHDLCQKINQCSQALTLDNWRIFGRIDFEFSHFAHHIKQKESERILLELFVPEIDLRITSTHLVIRAIDKAVIADITRLVDLHREKTPSHDPVQKRLTQDDIVNQQQIKDHYQKTVGAAVEEIQQGEYKKVILSRAAVIPAKIDIRKSFIAGRHNNTPARSFMLKLNDVEAFGFSPETVLEVDQHGQLSTQPLAGTRFLPKDAQQAFKLKQELLTDPKEIAEHAASVKLAIEELEQVCPATSVNVTEFMHVSERGSVQHLASRVRGTLSDNKSSWDAFKILFPSITASGIPKREGIEAIARFELAPRGLYSGSVLITDQNGFFDAALVLRAAYKQNAISMLQAGAGVICLSTPEREWEETCEKMACVLDHLVFEDTTVSPKTCQASITCEEE
ncbi:salicylate synthase [Vibrio ostreicida]|uniref:Salicylate synthase n=1 Tax=Vibrio ostreicida TaxID=526588 RepID=A0ABT8C203_9VIBR|nr:salicylate synthase [Vibrio ostreicida]MDN3612367.1 salicylate synthase [Vibrio ostreicida]NPD09862.1 salicylate synthase [Vibrio ostreicida]